MTEKLKPCAYCQSPLEVEYMDYKPYAVGGCWFVNCTNLDCPSNFNGEDKDEVIRVWNTRPRCGDCEYFDFGECEKLQYYDYSLKSYEGIIVDDDFYCAKFQKKEDV